MPANHLTSFAFNLSQHQGLFQWVCSSHQVAKVLELQLQQQSFQWIQVPMQHCSLWHWTLLHHQAHPQLSVIPVLAQVLHFYWPRWLLFTFPQWSILETFLPGEPYLLVSDLFALSCCRWDSPNKNTGVGLPFPSPVDHVLSEVFIMTLPSCLALPGITHSFTELHKPLCMTGLWSLWLSGKESACNARDVGSIPGLERSPGEGNGHSSVLAWEIAWMVEPGGL